MCVYYLDQEVGSNRMAPNEENGEVNDEQDEERNDEDIFSILVATDIHLGFGEKDPIRAKDTFDTFREILSIAKERDVDFVLLGGDLFHESRPSTYCLYKCTELLKRYCLGDRPVQIEYLSDPTHNFSYSGGNDTVNYEDPNLNVGLPVFSIHGNHDDPTGEQQISALNLLSSSGLVNYFGKYNNYSSVDIEPILLKKGQTKLALYGLSHIKDERLGRLFLDKNVTVMAPQGEDWFHLLVLHQNRANRGAKTFIPDDSLPDILDLVIWGHEHDCRIIPEQANNKVFISQPGSTVATSLCLGESIPKHVGLLQVHQKKFQMTPIALKTVRPFIFKDIVLKPLDRMREDLDDIDQDSLSDRALAEKIVEKEIEKMIVEAKELGQRENMLPLLRLNVTYVNEDQTFNAIRFGQKFIDRVANPKEMIKLKCGIRKDPVKKGPNDEDFLSQNGNLPSRVEDLVLQYFEANEHKQMKCLSLKAINESVIKCVDANEFDAPIEVTNYLVQDMRKKLEAELIEIDQVEDFVINMKEKEDETSLVTKILGDGSGKKKAQSKEDTIDESDSDEDSSPSKINKTTTSIRGIPSRPARGPGSRGGRGRRGRGARGATGM